MKKDTNIYIFDYDNQMMTVLANRDIRKSQRYMFLLDKQEGLFRVLFAYKEKGLFVKERMYYTPKFYRTSIKKLILDFDKKEFQMFDKVEYNDRLIFRTNFDVLIEIANLTMEHDNEFITTKN